MGRSIEEQIAHFVRTQQVVVDGITPKRKLKNTRRKGTRNEHRSMAIFAATGYVCTRSGASLGAWDFIGIGAVDIVLVQVKTRDWPSSAEMETLRGFPCPPNCRRIIHRWRDRQRLPEVKEL